MQEKPIYVIVDSPLSRLFRQWLTGMMYFFAVVIGFHIFCIVGGLIYFLIHYLIFGNFGDF